VTTAPAYPEFLTSSWAKNISLILLATAFCGMGVHHWIAPDLYMEAMPGYLPWHRALVYISGVAELIGGVGLIWVRTRKWAGWWLIALLLAVFPANIEMAVHSERFPDIPVWALWVRLPLQFVLGAWVWWASRPDAD